MKTPLRFLLGLTGVVLGFCQILIWSAYFLLLLGLLGLVLYVFSRAFWTAALLALLGLGGIAFVLKEDAT